MEKEFLARTASLRGAGLSSGSLGISNRNCFNLSLHRKKQVSQ